jgi:hypothetical protein
MIEIRQPELEALIMQRLHAGAFQNVEEVLYQALTEAPLPQTTTPAQVTTADMFAAFQSSPYKEIDLEPERSIMPISDPVEF